MKTVHRMTPGDTEGEYYCKECGRHTYYNFALNSGDVNAVHIERDLDEIWINAIEEIEFNEQ